jgi:hypothetical protein
VIKLRIEVTQEQKLLLLETLNDALGQGLEAQKVARSESLKRAIEGHLSTIRSTYQAVQEAKAFDPELER